MVSKRLNSPELEQLLTVDLADLDSHGLSIVGGKLQADIATTVYPWHGSRLATVLMLIPQGRNAAIDLSGVDCTMPTVDVMSSNGNNSLLTITNTAGDDANGGTIATDSVAGLFTGDE